MQRPDSLTPMLPIIIPRQTVEEDPEYIATVSTGTMKLPGHKEMKFSAKSLTDLGTIGSGNFGTVFKMKHVDTGVEMAVKRIRYQNITRADQRQLIREQETINKCSSPNIVQFYGVIFHEGDCWICMELMTVSLDRLYRIVYKKHERLCEKIIGHIVVSMVDALQYLKSELKIMHRDVKPSNVLISRFGDVKLCDFGICGELQNSIVKTHDVGCQPYLSPERIEKLSGGDGYGVRSDVWSLGITACEIATGRFPYKDWGTPFEQIEIVVKGDAPLLTPGENFSYDFCIFVNACLSKEVVQRPTYEELMTKKFYLQHQKADQDTLNLLGSYASLTVQLQDDPRA